MHQMSQPDAKHDPQAEASTGADPHAHSHPPAQRPTLAQRDAPQRQTGGVSAELYNFMDDIVPGCSFNYGSKDDLYFNPPLGTRRPNNLTS